MLNRSHDPRDEFCNVGFEGTHVVMESAMYLRAPNYPQAAVRRSIPIVQSRDWEGQWADSQRVSDEIGDLRTMLNTASDSTRRRYAGIAALDAHGRNNFLTIVVDTSESARSLLVSARHPSFVAQVTDVSEPLSGMTDPVGRSLGEYVECRLALGPDVWLAMIDRAQWTSRRQSTNRKNFIRRDLMRQDVK